MRVVFTVVIYLIEIFGVVDMDFGCFGRQVIE